MKRVLILTVAAVLALCLVSCDDTLPTQTYDTALPTPVLPDSDKESGYFENGIKYVIDSEYSCHVTGIGNFKGEELIIPGDDGDGRLVTYISDYAFANCTQLKKVVIPETVTEIKGGAFQNCTSLTEVSFTEGVNKIGVWAFYGCTSLTSVNIPASVNTIGQSAFASCSSITSFTVAENNRNYKSEGGVIYNKDMTTLVIYPIGNTSKTFFVPEGVVVINNAAFQECPFIETVVFASSVENVADHAFRRCGKLTTVTLSSSLKRLGVGCFFECTSLKTLNYPGTKETWDDEEKMELTNTWDKGAGKYSIKYEYKG